MDSGYRICDVVVVVYSPYELWSVVEVNHVGEEKCQLGSNKTLSLCFNDKFHTKLVNSITFKGFP